MKALKITLFLIMFCPLASLPASVSGASANMDLVRQLNEAFVDVAEKVSPAVVIITVVQKPGTGVLGDEEDDSMSDFWRRFHKQFKDRLPEKLRGEGSGVLIREDGYILTNGHVVEDAERIDVKLRDGRQFKATVRGIDPQSDVAVIKVDAKGLPVAVLADSNKTRVGEFAIAIGAPFSLDYSVTFGHVSAKERGNVIPGFEGAAMDQDFIQTDAQINPGNSGGPLVNINGEVIGINTLIRGLHTGIGFAIPSSMAREIAEKIITEGKFTRAWLGVGINALRDDQDFREMVKELQDGVVVRSIMPNGPAAKSELKPSDIITAVDGKRVNTAQQLRGEIRRKKIGEPVTLDVFRTGKTLQVKVKPGEWVEPKPAVAVAKNNPMPVPNRAGLGIKVQALTPELVKQFGADMTGGVLVSSVEKGTPAARKGIKPGDIITSLNQQTVDDPKRFQEELTKVDLKKGVILSLVSGNTARFEILKEGSD